MGFRLHVKDLMLLERLLFQHSSALPKSTGTTLALPARASVVSGATLSLS